jgi:hypothetical protein
VVDVSGNEKKLSHEWYGTQGLAWSSDGEEVWFTASEVGSDRYLSAVSLSGKERLVTRVPGDLILFDIQHDGRVLLARASRRREFIGFSDRSKEKDLSWLDYSYPADLSVDGKTVLFDEEGVGGGQKYGGQEWTYGVYLRPIDGSPADLAGNHNLRSRRWAVDVGIASGGSVTGQHRRSIDFTLGEHSPGDARQLIRQRHARNVVVSARGTESLSTVTFADQDGKTKLTMHQVLLDSLLQPQTIQHLFVRATQPTELVLWRNKHCV